MRQIHLVIMAALLTGCLQQAGSDAGSTTTARLAPEESATTTTTSTTTTSTSTTTTVPAFSASSLAGSYTSGSSTLDILADGSFTASTVQVYRITTKSNGSTNETQYACTVTGSINSIYSVVAGNFTTYNISITSSSYYRPTPNTATYAYSNYGCLGSATATQMAIEQVSATCMRVQNLGTNPASPDNSGLTYCK